MYRDPEKTKLVELRLVELVLGVHNLSDLRNAVVVHARTIIINQGLLHYVPVNDFALIEVQEKIVMRRTVQAVGIPHAYDAHILPPGSSFVVYAFDSRGVKQVIGGVKLKVFDSSKHMKCGMFYRPEYHICAVESGKSGQLNKGISGAPVIGFIGNRAVLIAYVTSKTRLDYIILSNMVAYRVIAYAAAKQLVQMPDGAMGKLRRNGSAYVLLSL
ncbi:unnamed protein product [Soboliphyme baturini]|uniref:Peptidase S1 domain-containing protein n=1 Tax=Soboliphyme baturini TaxID=241478 RepID=A0A183J963_9BILA|nr:unnamed protein product [Soboliphyme baturini]